MTKRVLILEDTAQVVDVLRTKLTELAQRCDFQLEMDVITTQRSAQVLNQSLTKDDYDLILLDYFAPDGNFHVIDFQKIDIAKVIAISSMPDKNQQAEKHGVECSIAKNNPLTDERAEKIIEKAEYILCTNS